MDETPTLERVQQLTQDYASYSQSRNGLGKVLGGVVGLIVALANGLIGPGWLTASLTIGLTVAWLISKEVIRRHFYQRFGEARERWVNDARRMHIGQVAFVLLVAVGATLGFIALGGLAHSQGWIYVFFVLVMPWVAWRYLRSADEFTVGVFLLCASAVTGAGGAYGPIYSSWWTLMSTWAAMCSLWLLSSGMREHRQFRKLEIQFQELHKVEE
jgi:hypothetical protein